MRLKIILEETHLEKMLAYEFRFVGTREEAYLPIDTRSSYFYGDPSIKTQY